MEYESRRSKRQKTHHNYAEDLPSSPGHDIDEHDDPVWAPVDVPKPLLEEEPEYDPADDHVSLLEEPEHDLNEDPMSLPEVAELPKNDQGNDVRDIFSALPIQFQAIGTTLAQFGQQVMAQLENHQLGLSGPSQVASPRDQVLASNNEASLLKELNTLKARLAKKEQELSTLKTSHMKRKKDTEQAEEGSEQGEEDLKSLQAEIKRQDKQIASQQKQLDKQHRQMVDVSMQKLADLNPMTRTQGPDVGCMLMAYKDLHYAIRNFALECFKGEPFRKPSKKQHKMAFQRLVGDQNEYETYLTDSKYKSCFVESVIWNYVIDELLQAPLQAYHGSADMENRTRACLQENVKDFPTWRAGTSDMLFRHMEECHDVWKQNGEKRVAMVEYLIDMLIRLHNTGAEEDMKPRVDPIVRLAVDLACIMSRARAYWVITMQAVKTKPSVHDYNRSKRFGFAFNEEHTELARPLIIPEGSDDDLNNSTVNLIVRPCVIKWGDSTGWNYENSLVIEKRQVIATAN